MMRVQDAGAASPSAQQTADRKKKPNPTEFSTLLSRKSQDCRQYDDTFRALPSFTEAAPLASDTVSSAAAPARGEAAAIRGLVREILVVAPPQGTSRVEIQFNSKTLAGLRVQISQDRDQIAIRFTAGSASTSNLLSRNLDQLSTALHAKGLNVGPIQVELAPRRVDAGPSALGSRDGRREQSEERRQQRQRQR